MTETDWSVRQRVRLTKGAEAGVTGTIVDFIDDGRPLVKWDDDACFESGETADSIEPIVEGE